LSASGRGKRLPQLTPCGDGPDDKRGRRHGVCPDDQSDYS
jgi:hypothetical protein